MPRPGRSLPLPARVAAAMLSVTVLTACGSAGASTSGGSSGSTHLALVAYSTPQRAYEALIAGFRATPAGEGVSFDESFGASGAQSRAVAAGQPADLVAFSLAPDVTSLVKAGLVTGGWDAGPHHGIVTDSLVVLVVRKGNPKGIHDWADLVRPGVEVVTPNVFSSGSAKWNLFAAYGAQVKDGKTPQQALDFVHSLLTNTVAQPDSGSKATAAFVGGVGDVLISYENEALQAQASGAAVDVVTPARTVLIENPIAVTRDAKNPALAKAFLDYLYSDAAQQIFASHGYRPVVASDLDRAKFPIPSGLFTIADFGGWKTVNPQFFDKSSGSISRIASSVGAAGGG